MMSVFEHYCENFLRVYTSNALRYIVWFLHIDFFLIFPFN